MAEVSPSVLPRHEFAPASFSARGKIATVDGSHPPASSGKRSSTSTRSIEADVYGLPMCSGGSARRAHHQGREAGLRQRDRRLGHRDRGDRLPGTVADSSSSSPLTLFNGGVKGAIDDAVYAHAYTTVPTPTATRRDDEVPQRRRRRQLRGPGDLTLPKIAGGSGSMVGFDFKVERRYSLSRLPQELQSSASAATGSSTSEKHDDSSETKRATVRSQHVSTSA